MLDGTLHLLLSMKACHTDVGCINVVQVCIEPSSQQGRLAWLALYGLATHLPAHPSSRNRQQYRELSWLQAMQVTMYTRQPCP